MSRETEHWKREVEAYERVWGSQTWGGAKRISRRAQLLIKTAKMGRGKKVLEIGCGTGAYTREFAKTGARLVATDLSPDMIRLAKRKARGRFAVADATKLPFKNNSFDIVVGNSILHHLPNTKKCGSEVLRVLKLGGTYAFLEPNWWSPLTQLIKSPLLRWVIHDSPDERIVSHQELRRAFPGAQLKPVDFTIPWVPGVYELTEIIDSLLARTPLGFFANSVLVAGKKE